MANQMKGLGKGLGALLGDNVLTPADERSSLLLPISQVESCSTQPRKAFDPDALADLSESIRQHGIIQPLTVRKLQSGEYGGGPQKQLFSRSFFCVPRPTVGYAEKRSENQKKRGHTRDRTETRK